MWETSDSPVEAPACLGPSSTSRNDRELRVAAAWWHAMDTDESMKLVEEVSIAYQTRFGQDPVLRMWNPVCAGINRC